MAVEYFALERHSRTDANDIVGWENLDSIVERTCEARGWLLKLQNRDGGWPTFCRGWGKLPFDRSGTDLTAHAIRAIKMALGTDKGTIAQHKTNCANDALATRRGFAFIERQQRPDGSWVPLWFGNQDHPDEENPIYGTAKVLMAYRDTGRTGTPAAQKGFEYLLRSQNADGGWGGGASVRNKGIRWGDQLIESTVEETALAVEALLGRGQGRGARDEVGQADPSPLTPYPSPLNRGLAWLCAAVDNGSLLDPAPIGFYFAKLWYYERLYPLIFTVSALGRAVRDRTASVEA